MKISEVRDGFIKFTADESIYLSSFVRVAGMDKDYIAQISSLKTINNVSIAYAKILFIMRGEELFNYDKTEPATDAEIFPFTLDILRNSVNVTNPVILGKTLDNSGNIVIDSSAFNKKMLISVDDEKLNNLLLRNLSVQFDNLGVSTVIIDTNNTVKFPKKSAGKDFKLPLNKITLQYLYNACINEATPDSRQMIADVFNDMKEYFDSVPFVPFGVLKAIVDDMVDKQHVFKLFVLKNKLSYLNRLGYFADNQAEAESLNKIIESGNPIIDISSADREFQNYYLEYIYSILKPEKTQVLLEASNNISKRNLKLVIEDSDVPAALIVHSKYRYLNDIKAMFDNFIIEPTFDNKNVFGVYNSFLSSMSEKTYLIAGEGINYIPMISKAQVIDEVLSITTEEEQVPAFVEETEPVQDEQPETSAEPESREEEQPTKEEIIANIEQKSEEVIDSISEDAEDIQNIDLFDEDSEDDDEEPLLDESTEDVMSGEPEKTEEDDSVLSEYEIEEENIIEPEYEEVPLENEQECEITEEEPADEIIQELEPDTSIDEEDTIEPVSEMEEISLSTDDDEISLSENEDVLNEAPEVAGDEFAVDIQEDSGDTFEDMEEVPLGTDDVVSLEEYENTGEVLEEDNSELSVDDFETIPEFSSDDSDELTLIEEAAPENQDEMNEFSESDFNEPVADEVDTDSFDEIVELDPDESGDNDIIIDISDEADNINIDEEIDQQIMEDVDKVYTTIKEPDETDNISDSDLDLIDELNSDSEEDMLEEYSGNLDEDILEQPSESIIPEKQPVEKNQEILEKRDSNTPIVPVYDADIPQEDLVISDSIQQGDSVVHAKYGNGIVEKMIKYGSKTLFSINFENIGRRLLDPTLTEIKKL